MTAIRSEDVIQSVADALQYISYYHPPDYIANLARAYELEESPASVAALGPGCPKSRGFDRATNNFPTCTVLNR